MASGTVTLSDLIVPSVFAQYVQQAIVEKSAFVQSGAMVVDPMLVNFLNGPGVTFNAPSFKPLDDDAENIAVDDPSQKSSPYKIGTATEIQVRLSRNNSWSATDLSRSLVEADPVQAIVNQVSDYWIRRKQAALIATVSGVLANNDSATDAYHTQYDMSLDISGSAFTDGVTNFSAGAVIDSTATLGDCMEDLKMIAVHSIVYARMLKNNLISFIAPSQNNLAYRIPTFLNRVVIVDDKMPRSGGVFESWLFGADSLCFGYGSPIVPVETFRDPSSGNGSGQETLFSRLEWVIHPCGHAYVGTSPAGGPSNAATTNNLAAAASWRRVFQRKAVKIARLKTREF